MIIQSSGRHDPYQIIEYDSFGRIMKDTNPGLQPFGFAGGLYDPDTGLVRFGARDYDPEIGRWTTKDPIGLSIMNFNLYSYVRNDPINRIDPLGLQDIFPFPGDGPPSSCVADKLNSYRRTTDDKYDHCVLSCIIGSECGLRDGIAAGAGKEIIDLFDPKGDASIGDILGDVKGLKCATSIIFDGGSSGGSGNKMCKGSCEDCCS